MNGDDGAKQCFQSNESYMSVREGRRCRSCINATLHNEMIELKEIIAGLLMPLSMHCALINKRKVNNILYEIFTE